MANAFLDRLEHIPPKVLKALLSGILWEGTPESGAVAVTFDDGPDPTVTPIVLDACDEAGIRGTFFIVGEQAARYPALAREIVARGHVIGNHSMTHRKLFLAGRAEVEREMTDARAAIADACGIKTKWFRPPYGYFDYTCIAAARDLGLVMVLWTVLAGDYSADDDRAILARIDPFIAPGSIIVLHDTHCGGNDRLPVIIREIGTRIRHRGLKGEGIDALSFDAEIELDETDDDE